MKKLMMIAAFAFVTSIGFSQTAPAKEELAMVEWAETTHDFGTIKQGVPVTYQFEFTNKGKVPVVITNAKGSCGCTTPDWTRDPVLPGGKGYVKATFNAAAPNAFEKTVTVTANVEGGQKVLHIKGVVEVPAKVN